MNIYDKAHELARALSNSTEYKDYKNALEKIKEDKKAIEMVKDFRNKQMEIQMDQLSGKDTEEKIKKLEELYQLLSYNNDIKLFLESEARFSTIFSDIQKIIGKSVDLDFNLDSEDDKTEIDENNKNIDK